MRAELPLVRSILALPGLVLRRNWLLAQLRERPLPILADEVNGLCESAEALVPTAREALVAWVAVLVQARDADWVAELRAIAHEAGHHSLARLLRRYSVTSSFDDERADAPNPTLGRELTVGERRSLARKPQRSKFDRLLRDPHPLVLRQLLGNPHLTENDVVVLATRRPARVTTLRTLAEFPDWFVRTRVKMAVLSNPWTPSDLAVPLLALAVRQELATIASSPGLHVVLRVIALELLERHPPFGPADSSTLQ